MNQRMSRSQPPKTGVVQPKVASHSQNKQPTAPSVYRAQPVPKALQTKMAGGQQSRTAQSPRQPVAPPVYRPQSQQVAAQAKMARPAQMKSRPAAPALNRSQT